jgi:hypothetical protein
MFICSVRAGTLRFFAVVGVALLVLTALVLLIPTMEPVAATGSEGVEEARISYENVRSNEERIAFLKQFGWEVEPTPAESTTVGIPREFDKVFAAYNEIQRKQGLDLSPYSGKTVERHTYVVKNYAESDGPVLVNLLISHGRVIGGDVCAADNAGFIHGFERP